MRELDGRRPTAIVFAEGMGSVMNWVRVIRIGAGVTLAGLFAVPAVAADYWQCVDGRWTAVGRPRHPVPAFACGFRMERPRDQVGCVAAGGSWGRAGLFPTPLCRVPTRDGGRVCGDTGECEGECLAALSPEQKQQLRAHRPVTTLGTCTPRVPVFGCQAVVRMGSVTTIICRD